MKIRTGLEGRKGRIELVPLLDVIFQVLVFFMYSTLFSTSQRSVDIRLPEGKGDTIKTALTIVIDRNDRISLGEKSLTLETAAGEVAAALAVLPSGTPVVIRADREARLGTGVSLLSRLHEVGITSLSFETDGSS
ncbi:MAG TPA: biopolymer transporter ExbD [Spirochaetia bacterium]|jgi:biopolymer transport protein ExbD|nr:biopolymer transporter ExbD [Spirochaetia bacterium]